MKLSSTRPLLEMQPVLMDQSAVGNEQVYWVLNQIGHPKWENMTIISPGNYSGEFPKTFGHYHGVGILETYYLLSGNGVLMLQKKHFDANGVWIPEMVDEVFLVTVQPGEEIVIAPEYGHSWSNVGDTPLVSMDDWRAGHQPSDYAPMKNLQGLAYYLVEDNGKIKTIPNPKYQNLPEPTWVTVQEFRKLVS